MAQYKVEVIEVLSRLVTIEARSETEALDLVDKDYREGELVLTPDDFQDVTIELFTP